MRKTDLINALEAIDGDPLVFVDINGKLSDDIKPSVRTMNAGLLRNMDTINPPVQVPEPGEPVILI